MSYLSARRTISAIPRVRVPRRRTLTGLGAGKAARLPKTLRGYQCACPPPQGSYRYDPTLGDFSDIVSGIIQPLAQSAGSIISAVRGPSIGSQIQAVQAANVAQQQAAIAAQQPLASASQPIIPGVSNSTLILGGAGVLALLIVMMGMRR